jgi:hypothetical protein
LSKRNCTIFLVKSKIRKTRWCDVYRG